MDQIITIPFGYLLDFLYRITGNYGVSLILFGIRGIAAYAYHAAVLGYREESIHRFLYKALFAIGMDDWGMEELLPIVLEVGEVNLAIDSLTVNVVAQSTLPLDALLNIKFLDEEKKELSQIKTLTTGKILGSKSGNQPTTSQISIGVGFDAGSESSVAIGALLGSVRAVECTVEGTTLAGTGLKPDQWLQATLSLCLDKGITIDLGTLIDGDEGEGEGENK